MSELDEEFWLGEGPKLIADLFSRQGQPAKTCSTVSSNAIPLRTGNSVVPLSSCTAGRGK